MARKRSCFVASAAPLACVASAASAGSPVQLSDQQMDKVTAGSWAAAPTRPTSTRPVKVDSSFTKTSIGNTQTLEGPLLHCQKSCFDSEYLDHLSRNFAPIRGV